MKTVNEFLTSNFNNFSQVYYGSNNVCRCGCSGEYIATSYMSNAKSEINDFFVLNILKEAKKMITENQCNVEFRKNNINISYGYNEAITFYFDELKNN